MKVYKLCLIQPIYKTTTKQIVYETRRSQILNLDTILDYIADYDTIVWSYLDPPMNNEFFYNIKIFSRFYETI